MRRELESTSPCDISAEIARSRIGAAKGNKSNSAAIVGAAKSHHFREAQINTNVPAGTPTRKMLRVKPRTKTPQINAAHADPAGFHFVGAPSNKYAIRNTSAIICTPPNVIQCP